jgi:hypothetical protein
LRNTALRDGKLCGFRREEVNGEGKKLLNEKLYDLYITPYIYCEFNTTGL